MTIRNFEEGDEQILYNVFYESIHRLACADYDEVQLAAWAPVECDRVHWDKRIRELKPFVALCSGEIAGYADLQPNGLIDHFFVSPSFARRGVGSSLMRTVLSLARAQGLERIHSHVSITAEPFFARFGFSVVMRRFVTIRGQLLPNTLMEKVIIPVPESGSGL